jgi:hypothetical protein
MLTIHINDHPYSLPETWEEIIESGQYRQLVEQLHIEQVQLLRLSNIFSILTGFDIKALDISERGIEDLGLNMVEQVFPRMMFIFDRDVVFTASPIPSFEHEGVTYTGPSDKLNNQTGHQWERSHHLQVQFLQSQDVRTLEKLVYVNYLPDVRGASSLVPLPDDLVYAIYLWYSKCERWWQLRFAWLFPEEDPEEEGMKKPAPATGMEVRDIIFDLAGNNIAEWDAVRSRTRADIIYAWDRINYKAEQAKKNNPQPA